MEPGNEQVRLGSSIIRLLLVEDDEDDYILTRSYLASSSRGRFEVVWSQTLRAARKELSEGHFDVVLLDLNLPDSIGWETFEAIHAEAPQVPVILFTGLSDEELGMRAIQQGAQDYLVKGDIDANLLARAIRYAVERKASEQALRRYQDHLEELVRARTERIRETNRQLSVENEERRRVEADLRLALAKLEEHNKAKSRFVSSVSHELKTPLASMSYTVENMLHGVVGPLTPELRSYVDMLNEDCQRLTRTINDILDLSLIEANTLRLHRRKTDLRWFVERCVKGLSVIAREKGVTITMDRASRPGFVECDLHKMERVVVNIVQNAIKYTPSGGHIRVSVCTDDELPDHLVLDVRDNGIGIPEKYLDRVTDRYFRVGEQVTGSGLGLSIAKDLVELHGGHIRLCSPVPGQSTGTQVRLSLPRVDSPAVLVAIGEQAHSGEVTGVLEQEGYHVYTCCDDDGAMDILRAHAVDIVLLDFASSGFDGIELLARLKSNLEWSRISVVASMNGDADRLKSELIEGFRIPTVTYPVACETLYRVLDEALTTELPVTPGGGGVGYGSLRPATEAVAVSDGDA
jgi:signal transduction histidine kinase